MICLVDYCVNFSINTVTISLFLFFSLSYVAHICSITFLHVFLALFIFLFYSLFYVAHICWWLCSSYLLIGQTCWLEREGGRLKLFSFCWTKLAAKTISFFFLNNIFIQKKGWIAQERRTKHRLLKLSLFWFHSFIYLLIWYMLNYIIQVKENSDFS